MRSGRLFDLETDPYEQVDPLEAPLGPGAREAWESLSRAIDARESLAARRLAVWWGPATAAALALGGATAFVLRRRRAERS